jgi:hypothetical protein
MPSGRPDKRGPVLLLTIFGAAALVGCSRSAHGPAAICASDGSIARIKSIVFERAAAIAPAAVRAQLRTIASQTQVKLIAPLVVSYDRDSRRVLCQAQAQFQLPPGVTMPTANPHAITQQVSFSSEPYADGSGRSFQLFDDSRLAIAIGVARLPNLPASQQQQNPIRTAQLSPVTPVVPARAPPPLPASPPVRSAPITATASAQPPPRTPTRRPARPPRSELVVATTPPAASGYGAPAAARMPERAPEEPPPDVGYVDEPTRVFIHIADRRQLAAAGRLQRSIGRYSLGGAPVATPPVRFVGRTPGRPEIRCLKAADCATAERLADRLAADLGERPVVVDLHNAFQNDPRIRRGSLELWLPSR